MSRISGLILFTAVSLVAGNSYAQQIETDMYVTLKGATAFTMRSTYDPIDNNPLDKYSTDFSDEWAVSGSIGRRLNQYVRVEAELGYLTNTIEDIDSNAFILTEGGGTNLSSTYLMGSVFFDLPLTEQLSAFAGGGIGIAKPSMEKTVVNVATSPDTQTRSMETEDEYVFAFKLSGGVSYEMLENVHLIADYSYFRTSGFDVKHITRVNSTPAAASKNTLSTEIETHMIGLGLRYDF
ncbi:outer membrane beta-barrel protein [Pseudovibrio sp. Tun.PSC04-5.I4]|uniref:outer membrane protein n=1 Tax=Pseudovibrio sp. Tun.PSC04-5.I4 TaxID=1798213 RepID=UPI0008802508|nr:outer membrane beta-barrel protein [Pseudovibrio sp. Tun.PSC04-5.I4]SDR18981.1 Opacity protein [Pseudovibrio sp. Tun.PSC04-5.I4]